MRWRRAPRRVRIHLRDIAILKMTDNPRKPPSLTKWFSKSEFRFLMHGGHRFSCPECGRRWDKHDFIKGATVKDGVMVSMRCPRCGEIWSSEELDVE